MDPWWVKIGPFALARARVVEVKGWRRWRWRIWRRLPGDPLGQLGQDWAAPDARLEPPHTPPEPPAMHWSHVRYPLGAPVCGAVGTVQWTIELEQVTCPVCRAAALPVVLKTRINYR